MSKALQRIEAEQFVTFKELCFNSNCVKEATSLFDTIKNDGIIKGLFEDERWVGHTGLFNEEVSFHFEKALYDSHIGLLFNISFERMKIMLKCYTVFFIGTFIFDTITRGIVNVIKDFLCHYQDKGYRIKVNDADTIEDFLAFICTPEELISEIVSNIPLEKAPTAKARKLSHLINYLVIANEIDALYAGPLSTAEFIRYFPIYFWVKITFILPLRATEMMVTPFDCLEFRENDIILRVRRTQLKQGRKMHQVFYDVERDYKVFSYFLKDVINHSVFDTIRRYQNLTQGHSRRYLFEYGNLYTNRMMSLNGFNMLLREFIDKKIMNNPKYDFAKKVCGIDSFEYVTAGDSRPIAMANLFFQNAGADICRQLANHTSISTSEGYFTNVSETLLCSSVMQMQYMINRGFNEHPGRYTLTYRDKYGCTSRKRMVDPKDIDDCRGHYENCFGCPHYDPSDDELKKCEQDRRNLFEKHLKELLQALTSKCKFKGKDIDLDKLFLQVQSTGARYRECTDVFAEKEALKWADR